MFIKHLIGLIAPHSCMKCGLLGPVVCEECITLLPIAKAETCYRCNKLSPNYRTCKSCRRHTKLARVVVASHFDGSIKQLIHSLKFSNNMDAASPLAQVLSMRLCGNAPWDIVVPVPASSSRFRQRGYNQAALIARELALLLGLDYQDILLRSGKSRQVGASRDTRLKQLQGSIYLGSKIDLSKKKLLLVDDVITTGATLGECASVLAGVGAMRIEAVVVAKH